jgi:hypothetical protein
VDVRDEQPDSVRGDRADDVLDTGQEERHVGSTEYNSPDRYEPVAITPKDQWPAGNECPGEVVLTVRIG